MAEPMLGAARWGEIMPDVTADMIRQWKHRKIITPDGLDEHGRPLYLQLTIATAEATTGPNAGRT